MLFGGWSADQLNDLGRKLIEQAKVAGYKSPTPKQVLHYATKVDDWAETEFESACRVVEGVTRDSFKEFDLTRTRKKVTCGNCKRTRGYRKAIGEKVPDRVTHFVTPREEEEEGLYTVVVPEPPCMFTDSALNSVRKVTVGKPSIFDTDTEPTYIASCNAALIVDDNELDNQTLYHLNSAFTRKRDKVTCKTCLKSKIYKEGGGTDG